MCLAKMTCFSYDLQQLPVSLLAAALIVMAVKVRVIQNAKCDEEEIVKVIADFAGLSVEKINKTSQQLL